MKKVVLFLTLAVVGVWLASPAWAQNADDIEALKQQIQQMQQQLQQQEMKIQQQDRKILDMEQQPAGSEAYVNMDEIVAKVQEKMPPQDGLTIGKGKIRVTPYGFIRLDMAYDDSSTLHGAGNLVAYVWPEDSGIASLPYNNDDEEFMTTATATRLGLNFEGPEFAGGNILGKIEIDFDEAAGGDFGGDVTAHRIRMRHAWAELKYPTWSFMFGQNWDIVAPRIPNMLDNMVMWGSGNVGYRRPQVRLSKWCDIDGTVINSQISLNHVDRNATNNNDTDTQLLDGVESGWPLGEARVGVDTVVVGRKLGIGLSGALGENEVDEPGSVGSKENFDLWLVALDGQLVIIPDLVTIQGELWTGDNLNALMGGVFQGIQVTKDATKTIIDLNGTVRSTGGFLSVGVTPRKGLLFNVGYGIDDPDNSNLLTAARDKNQTAFGNVIWTVVPNVDVGLELAWHETNWFNIADGDDIRLQTAFIYKF